MVQALAYEGPLNLGSQLPCHLLHSFGW
jgi:hypothetical protein